MGLKNVRSSRSKGKNSSRTNRVPAEKREFEWLQVNGVELRPLTDLSDRQLEKLDELCSEGTGESFPSAHAAVRYLKTRQMAKKR